MLCIKNQKMHNETNNITLTTETIYDRHSSLMYGCIYKIVAHTETAENILKDIFFDLHKNSSSYKLNIDNSMWFAKHAMKKAFSFIKTAPYQKDFAVTAMQQILEMKNIKHFTAVKKPVTVFH